MREDDFVESRKYIEIEYSPVTQGYLRQYCLDNGFDITYKHSGRRCEPEDFTFHSTIWFTTNTATIPNGERPVEIDDIMPMGFALFGEEENILVLEIQSERLQSLRDMFGENYDLEDEWPDYRPHISLSYRYQGELPDVALPDGNQIVADKLRVKDLQR